MTSKKCKNCGELKKEHWKTTMNEFLCMDGNKLLDTEFALQDGGEKNGK